MSQVERAEAPTPFGVVVAAVEHDGHAVSAAIALSVPSAVMLPEGSVADGYRRFEVTLRARARVRVALSIGFDDGTGRGGFGFAGGQYLMAAQISDKQGSLAVATHDAIWLSSYAVRHGLVPARFGALAPDAIDGLMLCRDRGLLLRLPELAAAESVRVFFACAWTFSAHSNDPETDAWFAAEAALPWRFPEHPN